MKTILNLTAMIILFSSGILIGQNDTTNWGRKSYYNKMYDAKTFIEIKGEITVVEQIVMKQGTSAGIHISVKTETETYVVHLGPKWYLDKQTIQLKVGDKVGIKGSKVTIEGKQTIIAKDVIKDGSTLNLRDETGKPVWAGKKNK